VSLRSVADGNFVVVDRTDGRQQIIAEVDYSAAALTLYEGAIHMIQSTPFQVERLDWEGRKAYVTRTHVDYYTDAIDYTKLKVLERFDGCIAGQAARSHGEVHVVRRVSGYKKIRYYTHENIGYGPVNLPDQELHTSAAWWQLPQSALDAAFARGRTRSTGFLGAAYALHVVATGGGDGRCARPAEGGRQRRRRVVRHRRRHGPRPVARHRRRARATRRRRAGRRSLHADRVPVRQLPGRRGPERAAVAAPGELLQLAGGLVAACDCRGGCPACVGPVLAADEDRAMSPKSLAARVLALLGAASA
jgi:DEAD/DEAH box helicase domain-containing protein